VSSLFEDGHEYAVVVVVVAILIMSSREDEIEDDVEVRSFPERTTTLSSTTSLIFSTHKSQSLSLKSFLFSAVLNTQDAPPSRVSTIDDAIHGEPLSSARTLCRNSYRLGFFGLPFVWGACAYYFSSSSREEDAIGVVVKRDKVVDEYVSKMRFGFTVWVAMASSWTVFWLAFGESVFGCEMWESASVTARGNNALSWFFGCGGAS
jgi:hypothetical protein